MRKTSSEWTVKMLTDIQTRINTEAEYQRGHVWSDAQRRLLIDSLLRGYDLPKIYLRKLPEGSDMLYEVVDGKQRLTTIWRYLDSLLPLARNVEIDGIGHLGRKTWKELPAAAKDRLQFAKVTVSELEDATQEDVAELFLRLQQGETLRAAERRNAIQGPVREFVRHRLVLMPVFTNMGIADRRMTWHELAAIALLLTIAGGPTTIKSADLKELYEDIDFNATGREAEATVQALSELNEIAVVRPGTITTRWGFVDLILSLRRLRNEKVDWEPATVMEFFVRFEEERKNAATRLSEFQAEVLEFDPSNPDASAALPDLPADLMPDMFTYVGAFAREGAIEYNVRLRSEVMFRRLSAYIAEHN